MYIMSFFFCCVKISNQIYELSTFKIQKSLQTQDANTLAFQYLRHRLGFLGVYLYILVPALSLHLLRPTHLFLCVPWRPKRLITAKIVVIVFTYLSKHHYIRRRRGRADRYHTFVSSLLLLIHKHVIIFCFLMFNP